MPSGPDKSCTLKPNTMLFESVKMKNTAERNEWGFTKESNDRKSRQLLKKTHTDLRTRKFCMGKVYGPHNYHLNACCLAPSQIICNYAAQLT